MRWKGLWGSHNIKAQNIVKSAFRAFSFCLKLFWIRFWVRLSYIPMNLANRSPVSLIEAPISNSKLQWVCLNL